MKALHLASLLALAGAACQTVDLGAPPADVNACRPSQAYFVEHIWPEVVSKDYGGKKCTDAGCHDTVGKGSLALIPNPMPAIDPDPMKQPVPVPLPTDWAKNYRAITEQMRCSDVTASNLVIYPTSIHAHGGGKFFDIKSPEVTAIEMWVTAP